MESPVCRRLSLHEKDGLSWLTTDALGVKHMFTRRLGGPGDFPYTSSPDPVWEAEAVQERVRNQWLRLREAGGFPAEGFAFTRQVHGTKIRYVDAAERRMPPLHPCPVDCDGLITGLEERGFADRFKTLTDVYYA